jgi:hypothetical protein
MVPLVILSRVVVTLDNHVIIFLQISIRPTRRPMEVTDLYFTFCSELVWWPVVQHEVPHRVKVDQDLENVPMLHISRMGKVQLSIKIWVTKYFC